jgi:hypothetical protein
MRKIYRHRFLVVVAVLAAGLLVVGMMNIATSREAPHGAKTAVHQARAIASEARPPMAMPSPTPGGALEARLRSSVVSPAVLPDMRLETKESGFYDARTIVSIQEDPAFAKRRYTAQGLKGGYSQVFAGTRSIRQVQAAVLSFTSPAGAAAELRFARSHERAVSAVTRLADPFGRQSFAITFKTEVGQDTMAGMLVMWTHRADVSTVYAAGLSQTVVTEYGMRVARTMYQLQRRS